MSAAPFLSSSSLSSWRAALPVLSLLLAACGSAPERQARPQAPAITPPAATANGASAPDALADGLSSAVKTTGIAAAARLKIEPLPSNPDPDSYAAREDAQQLALDIAAAQNLDAQWVWDQLAKARYKDSVGKLMMPAATGVAKNWGVYRGRFVEPMRIRAGVAFWRRYDSELSRAESIFGVPASIIAGVLGVETIYGRQTGNFRVLDVLTTLTLDFPKGRSDRSAFFKSELGEFLKLCQEQGLDPGRVLGSYAGAMGLPQFMPSSIRQYGLDFDGDGRVDLIDSPSDAIGSVARYLAEHGWQSDLPAYFDIKPPTEPAALAKLLAPDIVPSFSPSDMQALGATLPTLGLKHPGPLSLVQLQNGGAAPTFIAGTTNFYAITRYNQSSYYALAVIQLGEAVSQMAHGENNPLR